MSQSRMKDKHCETFSQNDVGSDAGDNRSSSRVKEQSKVDGTEEDGPPAAKERHVKTEAKA